MLKEKIVCSVTRLEDSYIACSEVIIAYYSERGYQLYYSILSMY